MNNKNLILLYLAFLLKGKNRYFFKNATEGYYEKITISYGTFDEKFDILVVLLFFEAISRKKPSFFNTYIFQEGTPSLSDFIKYTLIYFKEYSPISSNTLNMWIIEEFLESGFKNV